MSWVLRVSHFLTSLCFSEALTVWIWKIPERPCVAGLVPSHDTTRKWLNLYKVRPHQRSQATGAVLQDGTAPSTLSPTPWFLTTSPKAVDKTSWTNTSKLQAKVVSLSSFLSRSSLVFCYSNGKLKNTGTQFPYLKARQVNPQIKNLF